jgi:hypothetical protein
MVVASCGAATVGSKAAIVAIQAIILSALKAGFRRSFCVKISTALYPTFAALREVAMKVAVLCAEV